jgi:hypothetical protein
MTEQIRAPAINASYIPQQIGMSAPTSVHVCVEGVPFQYQLTEDDLMKVFSRYGCVSNISVLDEGGSAIVQFTLPSDAARATSVLDGKVLNGVHGALRVTLFPAVPAGRAEYIPVPVHLPQQYDLSEDISSRLAKKYTCRFEIPADLDPEFCVSKRIIGQKGVNMKKIVSSLPCADAAKLRLRGRGSGFLEGPAKQESNEPLHLCVSCRDGDSYSIVIREVTALLEDVYVQYDHWCKERGFQHTLPRIVPRNHPDASAYQLSQQTQATYPRSLYPPNWGTMTGPNTVNGVDWRHASTSIKTYNRCEYGQTPSPQSLSTHPGVSAANTPPDIGSPSSNGARRCPLDVTTIERIIEERNEARRICNFKEADRLRDMLKSYGIGLMDEPGARGRGAEVTTWRFASTTGTVIPQGPYVRK